MAALVGAERTDFAGDVKVQIHGLPPGISLQTATMAADRNMVPVLLEAAADAQPAGSLADVVGRHETEKRTIEGHLRQRTSLVRGRNNREVWNHYTDRMAVAVTEAAPYRIEIVQPKVPLVQNGLMELKVLAHRLEGFTAPITLRMLYNPPGISTPSSVTIPEGKSEVVIPLTANGKARVRRWKIAVMAEAAAGSGNLLVSSQLATLEVAKPFFWFSFPTVSVEQGSETVVLLAIAKGEDFEGTASVRLVGLPNEVTSQPKEITKDSTEVEFAVHTTEKSPPGNHKSLRCRAVVVAQGEPIVHLQGTGELRIQKPLPPKKTETASSKPTPKPVAAKPAEKHLSRLEKLRLQRQQTKDQGSE